MNRTFSYCIEKNPFSLKHIINSFNNRLGIIKTARNELIPGIVLTQKKKEKYLINNDH